jgi:Amt family ammonium transporter
LEEESHTFTRARSILAAAAWLAILLTAGTALGQDDEATLSAGDTAWILTSSALVLLMTLPGLALFYGGLVRSKNVLSILMQCLVSAGLIGVLWIVIGYSLAFGEGNAFFGNFTVGLSGITPYTLSGTIP